MGDVSYGACCICDERCKLFGADALFHYGHNQLISKSAIPVHYIPCRYKDDVEKNVVSDFVVVLRTYFNENDVLALLTTAQHSSALNVCWVRFFLKVLSRILLILFRLQHVFQLKIFFLQAFSFHIYFCQK